MSGNGNGHGRLVKCAVFDLDGTLWDGVLLEDARVSLKAEVPALLRALDGRGILLSVASRGDREAALGALERMGLAEWFLHPQVHWGAKSGSLERIAEALDIGVDSLAFIDDDPAERAEVGLARPEVACFDGRDLGSLLERPELTPRFVTADAAARRRRYLEEAARGRAEVEFAGPAEQFLATLDMVCTIAPAREEDLRRVEELALRANRWNATGDTYSCEDLLALSRSDRHLLLVAGLRDRFGSYGQVGVALVERGEEAWTIRLLLVSCRVVSRGTGTILLGQVMAAAARAGVRLRAELVESGRNRPLLIAYRFAGFREVGRTGDRVLLESDLGHVPAAPAYVKVEHA